MYKVCRHIRTSGGRCRSAALHNEHFCYYHLTQRRHSITLQLPPLEDRSSIQIAVSRVLASLAAGMIDRRDAGMYLYGIQIAATNLRGSINEIEPEEDTRRVVLTRNHDEIAEAETILEEDDDNYRHKDDCTCDACTSTETDTPHHPNCHCGECHLFAEEQLEEAVNIQAVADKRSHHCRHPERSAAESKDPHEQSSCALLQGNNRLYGNQAAARKSVGKHTPTQPRILSRYTSG